MADSVSSFSRTALILVDLQNDFCHPEGTASQRGRDVHILKEKLKNMASLLKLVRRNKLPVIHVISEHNAWTQSPSKNERYGRSGQNTRLAYCEPNSWGADIYPLFTPQPSEKVVVKHRYSGFLHTNLELLLRANEIEHIIAAGVNTDICLDSTVRDAYMRDFFVTIPYDCAASTSDNRHHVALELLDGTFGNVVHSTDIRKKMGEVDKMDKLLFIETGTGVDVHGQDANVAAERAVTDAIHYNSMPGMRYILPDGNIDLMKVHVKLAMPDPDQLDDSRIKKMIPYGMVTVEAMKGGMATTSGIFLEEHKDENDLMIIVNAAIEVGY